MRLSGRQASCMKWGLCLPCWWATDVHGLRYTHYQYSSCLPQTINPLSLLSIKVIHTSQINQKYFRLLFAKNNLLNGMAIGYLNVNNYSSALVRGNKTLLMVFMASNCSHKWCFAIGFFIKILAILGSKASNIFFYVLTANIFTCLNESINRIKE